MTQIHYIIENGKTTKYALGDLERNNAERITNTDVTTIHIIRNKKEWKNGTK